MSRLFRRKSNFRNWQSWLLGAPVALTVVFLSYLILRPDPAASHFYRAQKLQAAGQAESAMRLYSMIVVSLPDSSFAPLALHQEGEILTGMARRSGDITYYRKAIEAYAQLVQAYPSHSLAGESLLAAGNLAANELRDGRAAAGFYNTLLENYPANAEYASEATLRLGHIALQSGDGDGAQKNFTRVLGEYSRFAERCAEAQYHLGVTYETLLKNKARARSAYEATIKKWPRSVWAVDAKERLGMLLYTDGGTRPARKVLLEIGSLPASSGDSRLAALKLLLAARGMEVSDAVFRGWSLTPFRAGFAPDNSARTLDANEDFATIAANAGLVYSRYTHDDSSRALLKLRDELDAGHVPFISTDGWVLAVGYDSARDEIQLQRPGGERADVKSKEFAAQWRKSDYSLLSFHAPSETLRATVAPKPTPAPGEVAPDLTPPVYLYKLPKLSVKDAHRRVLRRATALMKRAREDKVLLNVEALRTLAGEVERLSAAPPESPVPAPETNEENELAQPAESTPVPTPTPKPAAASGESLEQRAKRWKNLRPWFDAPLKKWIETRRDAAAYLDVAATDLSDKRLQRAADEFRAAIGALQNADDARPAADAFDSDPDAARTALAVVAAELKAAHEAEKKATALMQAAS